MHDKTRPHEQHIFAGARPTQLLLKTKFRIIQSKKCHCATGSEGSAGDCFQFEADSESSGAGPENNPFY